MDLAPGDGESVAWTFECTAVPSTDGFDVGGPHIQGRPRQRFIYLTWGTIEPSGEFTMFRQAKVMLDAVPPDVIDAVMRTASQLVGRVRLKDEKGQPICAAVRPPMIVWSAARADLGPV